jgi:hypothetical protein
MNRFFYLLITVLLASCTGNKIEQTDSPVQISGIYPHLAHYNNEGECGTGAVVPWEDDLWVVSYGPHFPHGSSDKLYQITPDFEQIVRDESIGGTPANRMIHSESNQLFIGPYAINRNKEVRVIPYTEAPGRHTGLARHLTDPENLIYLGTMEEGFYEVDVNSLAVNTLFVDGNILREEGDMDQYGPLLPGAHGKGFYSGQGVMVYSNNGEATPEALKHFDIEAGALAEWDGADWKVVRRNQFVEVTGPGGIYGNQNPETDPIWATGWDHKSVILACREPSGWNFYRLPKASHSYDGAHGWNTEWPRIRDIGPEGNPDYLMTMHGMFWRFPGGFTSTNSAGIRPRSAYLKVIGDFTRWNGQLVFGCDDSAQREFLNKRKAKGGIEGPGQSNSNLWFTDFDRPDNLGPATVSGAVWLNEEIEAKESSEPYLFAGWAKRMVWIHNQGLKTTNYEFEVDIEGSGSWTSIQTIEVDPGMTEQVAFEENQSGEWIRITPDIGTKTSAVFNYTDREARNTNSSEVFEGLADASADISTGGLLYGLGDDRRALGIVAKGFSGDQSTEHGYYELTAEMQLIRKEDPETAGFIRERFAIPEDVVSVEESSILVIDDAGRRWRLPKGKAHFDDLTNQAQLRICREVATERDLFNCHGTFYELPAENADGYAKIRPVASHNFRIHDYASYRGMLIMTGIDPEQTRDNPHVISSTDQNAALWAGVIDDLWELGKPVGKGGPWKDSNVKANQSSDPYLIGFYDHKQLTLQHDLSEDVTFTIEVDPLGHSPWMLYKEVPVKAGETYEYTFPEGFQARWIRFTADKDCTATAWLVYD